MSEPLCGLIWSTVTSTPIMLLCIEHLLTFERSPKSWERQDSVPTMTQVSLSPCSIDLRENRLSRKPNKSHIYATICFHAIFKPVQLPKQIQLKYVPHVFNSAFVESLHFVSKLTLSKIHLSSLNDVTLT